MKQSLNLYGLKNVTVAALVFVLLAGCQKAQSNRIQGYVEGEYIYVGAPSAGKLETLSVQRGQQVNSGDALFVLDDIPEKAARNEAARRLAQSEANLEDVRKGRRPAEIDAAEAQLEQARAALVLSEQELVRQEKLTRSGVTAKQDLDRAKSARDQDRNRVTQLTAELKTAQMGARSDQIAAAEADVRAREAALARAEWELTQKRQSAPKSGIIFDTLYREGEWIAAGRPIVALLPPEDIKVRAFVPEVRLGSVKPGIEARVFVDGTREPLAGKVCFVSPQAEYTPPVIYSRESRSKLVFMIEIKFEPATAAKLNPGQPVDVEIGS